MRFSGGGSPLLLQTAARGSVPPPQLVQAELLKGAAFTNCRARAMPAGGANRSDLEPSELATNKGVVVMFHSGKRSILAG